VTVKKQINSPRQQVSVIT